MRPNEVDDREGLKIDPEIDLEDFLKAEEHTMGTDYDYDDDDLDGISDIDEDDDLDEQDIDDEDDEDDDEDEGS